MDRWLWGQASLPFLRGGVSRSSLSDTRPLTANEKDPSAPLEMTIREEHFSSAHFIRYSRYPSPTLSFRAKREIFLALRAFLLPSQKHSHFPYHTYDIIPFCKKDPSTSLGMTMRMALCSRYFHAATPKSASSRHIDPSLWSAPSLRRAKKGS